MKTRAEMLAWKRQMLIAECNAQRDDLTLQAHSFRHTLTSMEIGWRILGRVRQHPGWIVALTLGLIVITPRRLSSFVRLGSASLRMWRQAMPLLQDMAARRGL